MGWVYPALAVNVAVVIAVLWAVWRLDQQKAEVWHRVSARRDVRLPPDAQEELRARRARYAADARRMAAERRGEQ